MPESRQDLLSRLAQAQLDLADSRTRVTELEALLSEGQPTASQDGDNYERIGGNLSEMRYRRLFEAAQDGIMILDARTGHVVDVNPFLLDLLGYSLENLLGKELWEIGLFQDIASSQAALLELQEKDYIRYENLPLETQDGRQIDVEFVSNVYWVNDEKIIQCNIRDITERKHAEVVIQRLNRTLGVLSDINQAIVRHRDLPSLYEKACAIAAEKGAFRMAWIGLLDPTTKRIDPVAWAGLTDNYLEKLNIVLNDDPRGHGPTASALRAGTHLICNDIATDPRMQPWRDDALRLGYRALAALPLNVAGEVRGTFTLYADEPNFFNDEEIALVDEMAMDISFAMEVAEQEQQRRAAETTVQRYAQRMEILHQLDLGLIQGSSIATLVESTLKHLRRLIPCQRADVIIFDKAAGDAAIFADSLDDDTLLGQGVRVPIPPDVFEGYDERHVRVFDDIRLFQETRPRAKRLVNEGLLSALSVMLMNWGQPTGVLGLFANTSGFFTAEHQEIATEVANQLAIAIKQLNLSEELARHTAELEQNNTSLRHAEATIRHYAQRMELLHTIDTGIIGATSVHAVVETALKPIRTFFACQQAVTVLFDFTANEVLILASDQDVPSAIGQGNRYPMSPGFLEGLGTNVVSVIDDIQLLPESISTYQRVKKEGMRASLRLLLMLEGHPIGVLFLNADTPGYFTAEHQEIADEIARPLAIAIRQLHLAEDLARYTTELEQKVVERTADLSEAKERVEAILNNSTDGILLTNSDFRIQQANAAFNWLFACEADDYLNVSLLDLVAAKDTPRLEAGFQTALQERAGKQIDVPIRRKNGTVFESELSIGYINTRDTGTEGFVCIIRDVTERKHAQDALAEERNLLRTLIDALPDYVYVKDTQHRTVLSNIARARSFGMSPEETIGKDDFAFVPAEMASQYHADEDALFQSGLPLIDHEEQTIGQDKSVIWAATTKIPLRNLRGEVTGLVGVTRDITERKAQERQLRYHALLQENVSEAVIVTDMAFRIQSWNRAAERIYGWRVEEVIGKATAEILGTEFSSPEDLDRNIQQLREQGWWQGESIQHHKDGGLRHILGSVSLVNDENGAPFGIVAVNHDITERKRTEEALRQSEERFGLIFRLSPVAIGLSTAAEGRYLDVNDSLLNLLGYSRDEIIGRTSVELNVWETPEQRVAAGQAIRENGSVRGLELGFRGKTGEIRTTLTSIESVIVDDQSCFLSIVFDITERKRAEEALNAKSGEEHEFQRYLKALHEITIELTQIDELDRFYKRTVELGLERLGFERLVLFLIDEQNATAQGTYGVDAQGKLVDARHIRFTAAPASRVLRALDTTDHFFFDEHVPLYDEREPIGFGWNAAMLLWNGTRSLGWLAADNLLSQKPASKPLLDILGLYGLAVGTLLAQKQVQIALRESEIRYRLLAENVNDVISKSSPEGIRIFITPSCFALTGYSTEELVGRPILDMVHPEDRLSAQVLRQQAVDSSNPSFIVTQRIQHKDGHYIWVEVTNSIVRTSDTGIVVETISVFRDITERKRAEEIVIEQRDLLQQVITNAPGPITVKDSSGCFQLANDLAAQLYGTTSAELIGKTHADYNPNQAEVDFILQNDRAALESGQSVFIPEQVILGRYFQTNKIPLKNLVGDYDRLLVVSTDITERKRAEDAISAKLAEELEFQRYLKGLHEVSIELTQLDDLDVFYKRAVELGLERLGFERLALFLYDEQDGSALGTYGTDAQGKLVDEKHIRFVPGMNGAMRRAFEKVERFYIDEQVPLHQDLHAIGFGWNAATILWNGTQSLGWLVADNFTSQKPASKPLMDILGLYGLTVGTLLAQKQAQIALRESEGRYRLLAENATDLVVRQGLDGRYIYVSPSSTALVGYAPEELMGRNGSENVHPDDRAELLRMTVDMDAQHRTPATTTFRFQHKDGHYVWLESTGRLIFSRATGEPLELIASARDITERKQAEIALQEQHEFLQMIINSLPELVMVKDRAGRFQLVNKREAEVHGSTQVAMLGKTNADFNPNQAEVNFFRQKDQEALETGQTIFIPEETVFGRYYQTTKIPLKNQAGEHDRLLVVASDITERKYAEVALQQAFEKERELSELKSRFVSMASHEFRTPLAVILAITETLSAYRQKMPDDQVEQRLDKIRDQVDHLKNIMDDVLLLARLQARRADFKPVQANPDSLCRSVLDEFQSQPDIIHPLLYSCDEPRREVKLDTKLMRQIINNLVSNAIKYSPSDRPILVSLEYVGEMLVFKVTDYGIGIPEADLKHMFEPFHRAANVGAISGTGLGLVITKESVDLHGGTIAIETQAGVGTTFTVNIPVTTDVGVAHD